MTTQKAQRKIKSSTVAITVLSILLAIAVVSTIVLAAFTTTKNASTTITFGGNLTLDLQSSANTYFQAGSLSGDTLTISPTGTEPTGEFSTPTIQGKTNMDAFIGYKVVVTVTGRDAAPVTMSYADGVYKSTELTTGVTLQATINEAENFVAGTGDGVFQNVTTGITAGSYEDLLSVDIALNGGSDYSVVAGYTISINIQFIAADSDSSDGAEEVTGYSYSI